MISVGSVVQIYSGPPAFAPLKLGVREPSGSELRLGQPAEATCRAVARRAKAEGALIEIEACLA